MVTMVLLILALVASVNLSELGRFATARAFGVIAVELKKAPLGFYASVKPHRSAIPSPMGKAVWGSLAVGAVLLGALAPIAVLFI